MLEEPERRERTTQARRMWQHGERETAAETRRERAAMMRLDPWPRRLDQRSVAHARGTCGLAAAAAEAEIQMPHRRRVERQRSRL